ncbi:tetratricopeptide repeat protein [Chitinophagaceae bacterium LB-8]|uniref:Tetratricopeptide repeat protein n=1 Tax=Paraflavisolibacter caeni TaxID=2982496 RepID=A0A9X2XT07_9BACT|nr:tetratricopeptide repeat protein [Paraflavisolibacter caeni]MCU7548629.1 tetratricopeptide repeat protein [Paraflavisolibacter caeni]
MRFGKITVLTCLIILSIFSFLLIEYCRPKSSEEAILSAANEYVGDQKCQSCHAKEFNDWKTSDHFKAMLPANDSTVLGDFNDKTFTADGVTSRFFKKDGKFFINTEGADGKPHDFEVLYTFGYYPLQQYLISFPGGRMQVPRACWDSKNKKWFHQYAGQTIHSGDWLHWTGGAQNWNTMCATCHSTNLRKNFNLEADSFHTTYSIINVSCESCHGQGKKHIDYINSDDYKEGEKVRGSFLQLAKSASQNQQVNTCAPCHALKADISDQLIASEELMDNYIPQVPSSEQFHADGQVKGEVYIYTSFLQSKMFHRGVTCSNCHNPHSGKTLFASNQLCLQCHSKSYDAPSHHFHETNTKGAECKSCHMPAETFMGNDERHDHSFRVPRPDLSVQYGTPNACNKCHSNKTAQWSAEAIVKWYGPQRKYHFADDLLPGSKLNDQSEAHLTKLLNDTAVPPIIQAAAATHLGGILTAGSANALKRCLLQDNALIRYQALRSLANFPPDQWQSTAMPLLTDKVRAVRIAAADLYLTIPPNEIPEEYQAALSKAKTELEQYLRYQADFSVGNIMIADHYLRLNDYENATRFYLRGLKMDSLMNYARLNLSSAYSAQGKNDQALQVLKAAAATDPSNERVFYNLGLLYNELQQPEEAKKSFGKAVQLKSNNPRLYYNYGLLLFQSGEVKEAENVLLKGLALSPRDADLNYAISFLYIKTGQQEKARKYVLFLKQVAPGRAEYQGIFQMFP